MNKELLRMQKLAGLITESELKGNLNEDQELLSLLQNNPDKVYLNTGKWPRMDVKNFKVAKNGKGVIDFRSRPNEMWFFWTGENPHGNLGKASQLIGDFTLEGTKIFFTVMGSSGRAYQYLMARLNREEFTSKPGKIDYLKVAKFGE